MARIDQFGLHEESHMTIERTGRKLLIFFLLNLTICLASAKHQLGAQSPRTAIGGGAASTSGGSRGIVPPRPVPEIDGVREIGAGVFRITDARPLARVAELLQRKFGVPV